MPENNNGSVSYSEWTAILDRASGKLTLASDVPGHTASHWTGVQDVYRATHLIALWSLSNPHYTLKSAPFAPWVEDGTESRLRLLAIHHSRMVTMQG
ncbi:hypothetical protein [Streptomyces sp. NPDC057363]|uniref:hypothetical protein n=1 Tax=Streptomyces sp. NPDC057363 TaxID=3346107 RepID=UPI00363D017B